MYLRRTCNKCNCLLHLTELSLGTIVGVFLDAKPSKGLRSANDTETFRDVSLTNNLILHAKRNEVGSWKRSLVFLSFHVLAAHPFPNFPWGKRQDLMTSLALGNNPNERSRTISTYYSRRLSGLPGLKDSNTSVLTWSTAIKMPPPAADLMILMILMFKRTPPGSNR